jgi:hypothetical protein
MSRRTQHAKTLTITAATPGNAQNSAPPYDRLDPTPIAVELSMSEWIAVYVAVTESPIFTSPEFRGRRTIEEKIEAAITGG